MSVLVDWLLSQLWRRNVHRQLKSLERGPALELNQDAIWTRIAADIQGIEARPRAKTRSNSPWLLAATLIFALVAVSTLKLTSDTSNGIKSAATDPGMLPASVLAFAILRTDGSIARGSHAAVLHPGEAVIFYVETPGLGGGSSFHLDVRVETPDGRMETIIERYRITAATETIKGRTGFILYEPDAKGTYTFHGQRLVGERSENVSGFSIERLAP